MQQLSILQNEEKICAFTGHRVLESDFSEKKLRKLIEGKLEEGFTCFLTGMAIGFDMLAAEIVLSLKKKNPHVRLVACIPCEGQEKFFSAEDKRRYQKLREAADEVVVLSDHYYNGCMPKRNEYMVKRANCLIAYCKKEKGGTAYTVRYFQKKKPEGEILFL